MKKIRKMQRPRLATIIAGLALFIALGGSAAAAGGLINGKKIKKGTVTAKQLKNKTITKGKLKPALVNSLKGKTGLQGPKGAKGDTGAAGVIEPTYGEFESINLPANTELGVGTISVPPGKYMVTATARVFSTGTAIFGCSVASGGEFSESSTWNSPANNSRTTLPMQIDHTGQRHLDQSRLSSRRHQRRRQRNHYRHPDPVIGSRSDAAESRPVKSRGGSFPRVQTPNRKDRGVNPHEKPRDLRQSDVHEPRTVNRHSLRHRLHRRSVSRRTEERAGNLPLIQRLDRICHGPDGPGQRNQK